MPESPSAFAPFRYPAFRILWTATLVSNLGSLVQMVGAGWMMTTLTPSDDMVALVQASNTLPIMALALLAGAMADNYDRRMVMLAAQAFMLTVSVALALAAYAGLLEPWSLLAFTFLLGCGNAMNLPAWQASMRDIVPREDLSAAISLNSMSFNAMRSIGPAVGGLIVAAAGPAAAFTLNAFSYLALIIALLLWHPKAENRSLPREALGPAMAAGVRYVAMSPNLISILGRGALFGFGATGTLALLPLVAREMLHGTAVTYGVLLGAFGLGGILGALASTRIRARFATERIVRSSFAAAAVGTALVGVGPGYVITVLALVVCGASWVQALSLFNVSVQLSTPRWVVGRALALYQTLTFGAMAVGAWAWGLLSDYTSTSVGLFGGAIALCVGALVGLIRQMPEISSLDLDPLGRFSAPQLALDLRGRSGPIMVMIDWRIPAVDTKAFLQLMTERRRIRRRDGARQWVLLRDLENPEIWTESYHAPTWTEYLRHNERRTKADAEIYDKLLELHRGERPVVHRMIERQTVPQYDDMPIIQNPKVL